MISRRTGAAFAAVLAALTVACDDNPIGEGRTDASRLFLSHTNAVVEAGGNITVTANVLNRHGAPTGAGVTAQACDNRISVAPDTARTPFENPERFIVTGSSFGESCIVVSGGGITDTVVVRVVPARVVLARRDTVGSGETLQTSIQFLGARGQPVPGLTIANATFVSRDTTRVVVDAQGNLTGRAIGSTRIVATFNSLGVTRSDSFTVVVRPGNFTGTFSPSSAGAGQLLTLTAGVVPFDDDTRVTIAGQTTFIESRSASQIVTVVPGGLSGPQQVALTGLGPEQLSVVFSLPITSAAVSTGEPQNNNFQTAPVLPNVSGANIYGTVSATDLADYYRLDVPAGGATYTIRLDWPGGADVDVIWRTSAGAFAGYSGQFGGCATAGKPESCSVTLAAGTWYLWIDLYEPDAAETLYQLRVTRQP